MTEQELNFVRSINKEHYNNPKFAFCYDELYKKMIDSKIIKNNLWNYWIGGRLKLKKTLEIRTAKGLAKIAFKREGLNDYYAKILTHAD